MNVVEVQVVEDQELLELHDAEDKEDSHDEGELLHLHQECSRQVSNGQQTPSPP